MRKNILTREETAILVQWHSHLVSSGLNEMPLSGIMFEKSERKRFHSERTPK